MPNSPFTPEQISQILEEFFKAVGTRQYIGARYVPIFGRKGETSTEWDNTKPYEPLTIVTYQGNSFTSRQYVPVGVSIDNNDYWVSTGIYSAQVEQYRQEVQTFDGRITANTDAVVAHTYQLAGTDSSGLKTLIDANTAQLAGTQTSGLKTLIDDNTAQLAAQLAGTQTSGLKTLIDANTADIITLRDSILTGSLLDGRKSIGFGDSNMVGTQDGADSIIYRKVCTYLGCTYDNHGVNGAQFDTTVANSILAQVNAASYDADVALVLVIGGINDFHYSEKSAPAFKTDVRNTLTAIMANYPNALIVTMFDHGKQYPTGLMMRWPHEMRDATFDIAGRRGIFVHTTDLPVAYKLDGVANYYNQNHYNNDGTTMLAKRIVNAINGGPINYYTGRAWGAMASGLGNAGLRHTATYEPEPMCITNEYHFESANITYSASSIPAFTEIATLYGGFSSANNQLGAPGKLFCINWYGGGAWHNHQVQFDQLQSNYEQRGSDDAMIRLRNRDALETGTGRNAFDCIARTLPYA